MWYCKGRLDNADIPQTVKHPALLNKEHYLTTLIMQDAHNRVIHNGVKETLTQLRLKYWLIRGRQFVRKILHKCVTCQRSEGLPYKSPPPPPCLNSEFQNSQHSCIWLLALLAHFMLRLKDCSQQEGMDLSIHLLHCQGSSPGSSSQLNH